MEGIRVQRFRFNGHYRKTQSRCRFTEVQIQWLLCLAHLDVFALDADSINPQQIDYFLQLGMELHHQ